ncbi:MAG: ABC transporter substrate-binding protein [Candidatus Euphemobacter frigidus]|nr:ABC transporter substrate-binding protein [Candidatus Euphemobacter frigidus]MDP8276504.1 ABC transporter substrate-binding protein [Candidatus Euphemobacter frigidus]
MKVSFFVLLTLVVMFLTQGLPIAWAEVRATETVRFIGNFDFPPFAFKEDSDMVGFEIDLGKAIGRVMGAKVDWVPMSFDPKVYAAALEKNIADAVLSSLTITPERRKDFDFTYPYFRTTLAITALNKRKEGATLQFRKRKFEGSRVGVLKRTTGEDWGRKNLKATLVAYSSAVDMARDLWEKNLSAILIDEGVLNFLVSRYPYDFAIISRDLDHEEYGIAVKKGNQKLLQELNAALEKIDAAGVYDEIYNRWFGPRRRLPPH